MLQSIYHLEFSQFNLEPFSPSMPSCLFIAVSFQSASSTLWFSHMSAKIHWSSFLSVHFRDYFCGVSQYWSCSSCLFAIMAQTDLFDVFPTISSASYTLNYSLLWFLTVLKLVVLSGIGRDYHLFLYNVRCLYWHVGVEVFILTKSLAKMRCHLTLLKIGHP